MWTGSGDEVVSALEGAEGRVYRGPWIVFSDDHAGVLSGGMVGAV